MRFGSLIFISSLMWGMAYGQTSAIDSLENLVAISKPDTSLVRLLNILTDKYLASQPPKALLHAERALMLAQSLNDTVGEAVALSRISEYHWRQSNYAKSVEFVTQSLKLALARNDSTLMANAYRLLGIINNYGFKQYDRALTYMLSALAIHEQRNDLANMASLYGNISWIYGVTGKNLEEGKRMTHRGLQIAKALNNSRYISYNYNSLALIAMQQQKLDSALYFLNKSIEFGKLVNDQAVVAYNNRIKGSVYSMLKNWQYARTAFHESEQECLALDLREVLKDTYNGLAEVYGQTGNYALAFEYQRKYTALKDSIMDWEITQKALAMEFELDEQKREARIIELQQQSEQANREKNIYLILMSVGLLSLAIIMVLIIRNNRQRSKSNALLKEKNQEIANQNQQLTHANSIKDRLFSIIGHDLRSPLQSLKGLLGLVVQKEVSPHEFQQFAPQLHQHVIGVNETLENLLNWSKSQMEGWKQDPAQVFVAPLINRVTSLFKEAAAQKRITISININAQHILLADSNQVELIFRNLVHNAIKFTPEGGEISIVSDRKGGQIEIAVSDTGVGMKSEQLTSLFEEAKIDSTRGTQGERGTGLGLVLCRDMAKRNGGSIQVQSEVGRGSIFIVILPTATA